jgi:hypothetical protein
LDFPIKKSGATLNIINMIKIPPGPIATSKFWFVEIKNKITAIHKAITKNDKDNFRRFSAILRVDSPAFFVELFIIPLDFH